jgi:hypothetical protein
MKDLPELPFILRSVSTDHAVFTEAKLPDSGELAGFVLHVPGQPYRVLNPQAMLIGVRESKELALDDLRRRAHLVAHPELRDES